jgi:PTH1 family peptidyl-tRNA hydrolase
MHLIVGLGNPGDKYKDTRHNIGFSVVDKFVKAKLSLFSSIKAWRKEEKLACDISHLKDIFLIKPTTYMNLSGMAVQRVVSYYKIEPKNIIVVHDDIDLPLGKVRIRRGGASAGHRGVQSIIKELKTDDFVRVRLGIGRGRLDTTKSTDVNLSRRLVKNFVLSKFRDREGGDNKKLVKKGVEALSTILDKGEQAAMNKFN